MKLLINKIIKTLNRKINGIVEELDKKLNWFFMSPKHKADSVWVAEYLNSEQFLKDLAVIAKNLTAGKLDSCKITAVNITKKNKS